MRIRLDMKDYLDIHVSTDGKVHVIIGRFNKNGVAIRENSYANSSFATFMKFLGIYIQDLSQDISEYISENGLFLRIKRDETSGLIQYNLHDADNKEELVSYNSFEELIETEVLQMNSEI